MSTIHHVSNLISRIRGQSLHKLSNGIPIYGKEGGRNTPKDVLAILAKLAAEGLVTYNALAGTWHLNAPAFKDLRGISKPGQRKYLKAKSTQKNELIRTSAGLI
jgi:hypothetical protein